MTLVQKINFLLLFGILFSYPGQNYFQRLVINPGEPKVLAADISLPSVDVPVSLDVSLPQITAQSAIIYDPDSGTVLYQKNPNIQLDPASTTKIMTALVSLESYKLTDVLTVQTADRAIGNTMKLIPGDKLVFVDLLQGLLIASANDAAVAIAENYPGGYAAFVQAMNQKAKDLGLDKTNFTNVSGIEGVGHKTTVLNLAILTNEAMKNPIFARTVATPKAVVTDISTAHAYPLYSTNQLLGTVPGLVGVKTGWTENAGECLVTLTKRNNRQIITVVLNSKDRFGESRYLIEWAYKNFNWKTFN